MMDQLKRRLRVQHVDDEPTRRRYLFSDICAVSTADFPCASAEEILHILIENKAGEEFGITARATQRQISGRISLSKPQQEWCSIAKDDDCFSHQFHPSATIKEIEADVSWALENQKNRIDHALDVELLTKLMRQMLDGHVIAPEQQILLQIEENGKQYPLIVRILALQPFDDNLEKPDPADPELIREPHVRGLFSQHTKVKFSSTTVQISRGGSSPRTDTIIRHGVMLEDLGIGGLDMEFQTILRRALASRTIAPDSFKTLGINHVRGILLYGPPGTGKTLIARKISQVLNAREPKIVNGPEIMNKFVGQSEENLRRVFQDAKEEDSKRGSASRLHVIIFDELDAICKSRGSEPGGGTSVGDSIVNQLLAILDGVNQLGNILVIGTTNRKDMIDEALLRPGRMEVLVEIGLPNKLGRLDILKIHTRQMSGNGSFADDVSLDVIAEITENFTGAELTGVINSATAYAINRTLDDRGLNVKSVGPVILRQDDFIRALTDIHPSHGGYNVEMKQIIRWGIHAYAPQVPEVLHKCRVITQTVRTDKSLSSSSILLHGIPGSGTSSLAIEAANRSGFPFVQMISRQRLAYCGTDLAKIAYINGIFEKADRSECSIIILDDIVALVGWNRLGPVYSIHLLLTLQAHLQAIPAKGRRRVVISTTSDYDACERLGLMNAFDDSFRVDPVKNLDELSSILLSVKAFDKTRIDKIRQLIESSQDDRGFELGVKHILTCWAKTARAEQDLAQPGVLITEEGPDEEQFAIGRAQGQDQLDLTSWESKQSLTLFVQMLFEKG